MKRIFISAACLLSLSASGDVSKVVVYPPSLLAACPSVKSTSFAHPSYSEVSATADDGALTLTFKGQFKVCDRAQGGYQWNTVNPYDYYVSYITPDGQWSKRHEVINPKVNPNNRLTVSASLLAQKLFDQGALSAYNNGFKGNLSFDLDQVITDSDQGDLNDGEEVTKTFATTITINTTTYLNGQFVDYAQAGDVGYAQVNVDVTFKKAAQGARVVRLSVY